MNANADFVEERSNEAQILRFTGRLTLARIGDLPKRLDSLAEPPTIIDLGVIERIDTVGAWIVHKLAQTHGARIVGASVDTAHLLAQVGAAGHDVPMRPAPVNPLARIVSEVGEATILAFQTGLGMLSFFGATMIAFGAVIRHPSRFRLNAVIQRFELVGVKALAIIGLMSFLIGIVIAQQGAVQLAQFGAEVFTVNLVGRLSTRELGVLMTAIMVAGRSGSAFAAQIGTMKLTEEIDAMRTIGVSPIEALVLPRVIAVVAMMPLLAFFAIMMSLVGGGFFSWISLEIPPITFVQRLREVIPITDLYVAMIKAIVFGAIVAMTGCFQGLQVENNSEEVGTRTTAAVVQAIFMVIVLDAFFAVFFTAVGWK
jgi:phospholipid/cholesterol/gamma-HCH transport system permease protein